MSFENEIDIVIIKKYRPLQNMYVTLSMTMIGPEVHTNTVLILVLIQMFFLQNVPDKKLMSAVMLVVMADCIIVTLLVIFGQTKVKTIQLEEKVSL